MMESTREGCSGLAVVVVVGDVVDNVVMDGKTDEKVVGWKVVVVDVVVVVAAVDNTSKGEGVVVVVISN